MGAFAASLALSLVLAELLVDRFLPVGRVVYARDDVLLYDALPDRRRIQAMPPASVRAGDSARVFIETNSLGLRGPELDEPRSRPRLLVLGDSFVMAENVPLESTFVRQLEHALAARLVASGAREGGADDTEVARGGGGPAVLGVECLNAGRSGYGPDQALLLAERLLEETAPDAVLLVLCSANDLGDVTRNKLFQLEPTGRLVRQKPRLAPRLEAEFDLRLRHDADPALVRLWRFSRVRRAFAAWPPPEAPELVGEYRALLEQQAREAFEGGDRVVRWLFEDVLDVVAALEPDGVTARRQVQLQTAILRELRRLCDARGIACGALVTPVAADLCPGFIVRLTPERFPGYEPGTLPRLHRAAAEAAGLRVLDVSAAFAEHADPGSLFVGGDDQHWNAAGQALAARRAAEALVGWPELRRSAR